MNGPTNRTAQEQNVIARAKRRLRRVFHCDEPTAYHRLRKAAMNRREPIFVVADEVLWCHRHEEAGLLGLPA